MRIQSPIHNPRIYKLRLTIPVPVISFHSPIVFKADVAEAEKAAPRTVSPKGRKHAAQKAAAAKRAQGRQDVATP